MKEFVDFSIFLLLLMKILNCLILNIVNLWKLKNYLLFVNLLLILSEDYINPFKYIIKMLTNVMKKAYLNKVYNALPIRLTPEWRMKIACQFALESDFGRSFIAVSKHNHCGMKVPSLRVSTTTSSTLDVGSFASFDSFESCVSDYLIWLAYNKVNSYSQWENALRIYCPESDYYNRINSIYKQFKK